MVGYLSENLSWQSGPSVLSTGNSSHQGTSRDVTRSPIRIDVKHVAVTTHPTAAWTAQQLREAFPLDEAPRYLIHDCDHAFDSLERTTKAMGIEDVLQRQCADRDASWPLHDGMAFCGVS
jgi:hypothetical protein